MPNEPSGESRPLAAIDMLVHEPARLAILTVLYVAGGADFTFLQKQTGLTRGNLSAHLQRLETAGYISIEKKFVDRIPRTLARLTDSGREALRLYRERMQHALRDLPT